MGVIATDLHGFEEAIDPSYAPSEGLMRIRVHL